MIFDGWCPDCDMPSAIVDAGDGQDHGWATCTECEAGWLWRDDAPEPREDVGASERRAA